MATPIPVDENGQPVYSAQVWNSLDPVTQKQLGDQWAKAHQTQTPAVVTTDGKQAGYVPNANGGFDAVPNGTSAFEYQGMTPEQKLTAKMLGNALDTQATNRGATLGAAGDILARDQATNASATAQEQERIAEQRKLNSDAAGLDWNALGIQRTAAQNATDGDMQTLGNLSNVYGAASGQVQGAANDIAGAAGRADYQAGQLYGGLTGAQGRADAQGYGLFGDLSNAAQTANAGQSNVADKTAAYLGGLKTAGPISAGADLSSAAARAASDPSAAGMQKDAASRFLDIASGGADLTSAAANSQADPEALAALKGYLSQYQQLSNPGVTAAERFGLEKNRSTEEQDQRSRVDAQLSDLSRRGIRSGGAEIGAVLGAGQITSQNRMLQDLALQAAAEQRAERMMASGTQLAGQIGDTSYQQAFGRGTAADNYGLANRAASISALGAYAGLGNDIRSQSFNEGYQTGQSGDAMAQFNRNNSLETQQYNAELQRQQNNDMAGRAMQAAGLETNAATDAFGRASGVNAAGTAENAAQFGRAGTTANFGAGQNDAQFGRAGTAAEAQAGSAKTAAELAGDFQTAERGVSDAGYNRMAQSAGMQANLTDTNVKRGENVLENEKAATDAGVSRSTAQNNDVLNLTNLYTGGNANGSNQVSGALETQLGQANAQKAIDEINKKKGGLLGGSLIPGVL